ncbi:MAG TPA: menaquinone biosynthesis protein [Longimicrobiales bacterium]|nr:menaquinone biosynthesis protein [Longimicrobiales bacterium]
MIRLGHIEYSNCFPIHAELLEPSVSDVQVVRGTPAELNRALDAGEIDLAPASSIEYARHVGRYRVLPDFVIGAQGAVHSILFESTRPIDELNNTTVAIPTASATSVVLLKVLLRLKYNVTVNFQWFTQESGRDPVAEGAAAALWIGDVALRRAFAPMRLVVDLGSEWTAWTHLPFAFAVWQTTVPAERAAELAPLMAAFRRSRARFREQPVQMAEQYAHLFGMPAAKLARYWKSLRYEFDPAMQDGLLHFYRLASTLGEAPRVDAIAWA